MNAHQLDHIAELGRRLPREGSAFPKTDKNARGKINTYVDGLIVSACNRLGAEVSAHWRTVVDQRLEADRRERRRADRSRSLLGYLAMWWNREEYEE